MKLSLKICATSVALFLLIFTIPRELYSASRDCDGNAVIYCGVLSKSELTTALKKGTGKKYQSAKELSSLFSKYGALSKDIDSLQNGRVTKDGKVYIGSKVVAKNILSTGRHKTTHSKQVSGVPYPLYERPPRDSFLSESIDAYVKINYDGSMAYAIIKSCGNIIKGVGIKVKPSPQTVSIKIQKFEDSNGNKRKDLLEKYLVGWNFKVTGSGFDETVSSDEKGTSIISGLKPGKYTVTEIMQDGWENTTGVSITRDVTTNANTQLFLFGNKRVGEVITEDPGGGDTTTEPTQLPDTGPAEVIATLTALLLTGSILYWTNSRKKLKKSRKKTKK